MMLHKTFAYVVGLAAASAVHPIMSEVDLNPWTSLGIQGALAVVVGYLLTKFIPDLTNKLGDKIDDLRSEVIKGNDMQADLMRRFLYRNENDKHPKDGY